MFESKTKQILKQTLRRSRHSAWCHKEDCVEGEGESHEIITEKCLMGRPRRGDINFIKSGTTGFW